jgi:hypothetical protein
MGKGNKKNCIKNKITDKGTSLSFTVIKSNNPNGSIKTNLLITKEEKILDGGFWFARARTYGRCVS